MERVEVDATGQAHVVGDPDVCICVPCTQPAYGVPGRDHCAACCYGTLVIEYDHACPVAGHRELAVLQFGAA